MKQLKDLAGIACGSLGDSAAGFEFRDFSSLFGLHWVGESIENCCGIGLRKERGRERGEREAAYCACVNRNRLKILFTVCSPLCEDSFKRYLCFRLFAALFFIVKYFLQFIYY